MNEFEEKIKKFISDKGINAEHLSFEESCHSVEAAAKAANAPRDYFIKNICLLDSKENLIVAIVKGENNVSTKRIAKTFGIERPRLAKPNEILDKTGYPCGGVPSFGYNAKFLIDPRVMEKDTVYSGGGSEKSLIRIPTEELVKANEGEIVRIRK
jgi:prolyl-tRNA editing enzyme YbaK/EbsC (Cys-tRNA(Pro) deacylase)